MDDSSPLADPWIAAQIDAAVAPYVGRLPAHEVAWMREQLAEVLARDPKAAPLLRGARAPDQSGERLKGTADAGAGGESPAPGASGRAKGG
jgi:hypothetical protein